MKILMYINQIYLNEPTGQSTFEKSLIEKIMHNYKDTKLIIYTATKSRNCKKISNNSIIYELHLDKKTYGGYLMYQLRLFKYMLYEIWNERYNIIYLYQRYSDSMIVPCLLSVLFRMPLTMRTGPLNTTLFRMHEKAKNRIVRWLLRGNFWLNCCIAKSIIVVTNTIADRIKASYSFANKKIVIIPNGVDVDKVKPVKNCKVKILPNNVFIFGFVGHIYIDQGLQTVIHALDSLRDRGSSLPCIFVVGEGPYLPELKSLVKKLSLLDNIIFYGAVQHDAVPSLISACDVMLAPFTKGSIEETGSSALKLFEYLACDKPVLASLCADHLFLEDKGLGWLAEPDNVDSWAIVMQKVMQLIDLPPVNKARLFAEEYCSFDTVAKKIVKTIL